MSKALSVFHRLARRAPTWAEREAMQRMIGDGWNAEDAARYIIECDGLGF